MNSMNFYDIRAEKANAILKHRQLRKFANLFRLIELCLILIVISRFSIRLPTAFKNSGEYFRCLSVALINPRFVFLIGNAIVIILFAKSRKFYANDPIQKNSVTDIYEEFIKNNEKNQKTQQIELKEESMISQPVKKYRRSRSENMMSIRRNENRDRDRELRRSETEKCREIVKLSEGEEKSSYEEDGMSNEEFRRTVEEFIARQQKLRREEEYCVF